MTTTSIARPHWDDRLDAVTLWAELDHRLDERPRPRLLGYVGDDCLCVIDLRTFPPGGADQPVVEAMAALLAVGCDGIVAALPGRAWSLDDPVVPVVGDVDLRQPVVAVHASRRQREADSWLLPHRWEPDGLVWLPRLRMPGPVEGRIPTVIEVGVQHGLDATPDEATQQLRRCIALGHEVMLLQDAVERGGGRLDGPP